MTLKRQLSRNYRRSDLKCFVVVLIVLAVFIVAMMLFSQYRQSKHIYSYSGNHEKENDILSYGSSDFVLDTGFEGMHFNLNGDLNSSLHTDSIVQEFWKGQSENPTRTFISKNSETSENLSDNYFRQFRSPFVVHTDYQQIKSTNKGRKVMSGKKIITWFAAASEPLPENMFDDDVFDQCPVSKCKFVSFEMLPATGKETVVDAVIFPTSAVRDKSPPTRSHSDQVYVYYDMNPDLPKTRSYFSDQWNSIFNWTWSYRRDSDIWQPHGNLRINEKVKTLAYFESIAKEKKKKKHAAWLVNSCHVPSRREQYVKELANYINIDTYGRCGNKSCPKGLACLQTLTQKYFFYLSFESAFCNDYVSGKFFKLFYDDINIVPVVFGGAEYKEYFANGTYVDTRWFPSSKDLSEFLKQLMESKKIYSQFLWRKSHYTFVDAGTTSALCQLCQRLHDSPMFHKTYPDLYMWHINRQCYSVANLK